MIRCRTNTQHYRHMCVHDLGLALRAIDTCVFMTKFWAWLTCRLLAWSILPYMSADMIVSTCVQVMMMWFCTIILVL